MCDRSGGGVHRAAADGFGAEAEAYERARPSYPPEAVSWLLGRMGVTSGRRVVDLAAGTGKLTALLADRGVDVVAIEPVGGMRRLLRARLPGIPVLAATAEALPFADGCLHAVTVAQAFHWFDAARAMAEAARVIRPGGHLGLAWNARDRSVDWVDRIWAVMDRVERRAPWRDHGDGTAGPSGAQRWKEDALVASGPWTPFERATFTHVHEVTPDQVVDRMRSISHIAALPAHEQARVLHEVRTILREHPAIRGRETLGIRYRVDVLVTNREAGRCRS